MNRSKKMRFPKAPKYPERICWGCDRFCATHKMMCGNGSERVQHPAELMGALWYESLTKEDLDKIELI